MSYVFGKRGSSSAFVLLSFVACMSIQNAHAKILIDENFGTTGSGRSADTALNGLTAQVGGNWKSSDLGLTASGTATAYQEGWSAPTAAISLPAYAQAITVTASISVHNIIDNGYWTGLSLMASDTSDWWGTGNSLWFYVKGDGQWGFSGHDSLGTAIISGGTLNGFDWNIYHTAAITYDPVAQTATVSFDGAVLKTFTGYTGNIGAAGFHFQSLGIVSGWTTSSDNQQIDSFTVTEVPEAATCGILAVGGSMLALRGKKNRI